MTWEEAGLQVSTLGNEGGEGSDLVNIILVLLTATVCLMAMKIMYWKQQG